MQRISLKSKVFLILILVIFIPVVCVNYLLISQMESSLKESSINSFNTLGAEVGNEIEHIVREGRDNIVLLSQNPIIKSNLSTKEEKLEQLTIMDNFHQIYDDITLIDKTGTVITSVSYNYRGEWDTNAYYQNALDGNVVVSDAHIILNPYKIVVSFLAPIYDVDGTVKNVVAGQMDMAEIHSILDDVFIGETGTVILFSNEGTILYHQFNERLFDKLDYPNVIDSIQINQSGITEFLYDDGERYTGIYLPLMGNEIYHNGGHWGLLISQANSEMFAPLYAFQQNIMIFFVSIFCIILIVGVLFTRGLLRPIYDLKKAAVSISQGNFNTKIKSYYNDEIGDLAAAFKQMSKDLNYSKLQIENHTINLERTVEEKTKELYDKINELEKSKKIIVETNIELQNNSEELQAMNEQLTAMNEELNVMQEELTDMNNNLEEKVKQRTDEVQHLLYQKEEFINQLSHDLKTPLTPMMLLLPMIKKLMPSDKAEMFDAFSRSVSYMKDLINETIELAKLNTDKIQFEMDSIQLFSNVDIVLDTNKLILDQHNIMVKNNIDPNVFVYADGLRVQELFNNLIVNGVKYSNNDKGVITVDSFINESEVVISVKDTGIGMTSEQIGHVFDEFYKADTARHDHDSHGLGLSICKRIVEKHGGRIWVESDGIGMGSTFYFTLPRFQMDKKKE